MTKHLQELMHAEGVVADLEHAATHELAFLAQLPPLGYYTLLHDIKSAALYAFYHNARLVHVLSDVCCMLVPFLPHGS